MNELEKIRAQIDWLDKNIMEQLEHRFELVEKVKKVKKEHNIATLDSTREATILHYIDVNCEHSDEIKEIYVAIMDQSKKLQKQ